MKLLTALKTKLPLRGDNGTKTTIYVAFEIITGWNMEGCMYVYMIRIEESNDKGQDEKKFRKWRVMIGPAPRLPT
jgi:hypothetical protein